MAQAALKMDDRYTWDDYRTWPEGERWELIGGAAYAMAPSPSLEHQDIALSLGAKLKGPDGGRLMASLKLGALIYYGRFELSETRQSHDGSRHVTDEHINVYTHLAAAVLAVLGLAHLVVSAGVAGKPWHVVAFAIYGASLFTRPCNYNGTVYCSPQARLHST